MKNTKEEYLFICFDRDN